MKKVLKVLLFLIIGLKVVYLAGWFYAAYYVKSLLKDGYDGKNSSIKITHRPEAVEVTGLPHRFIVQTKGDFSALYARKSSNLKIPVALSGLKISYTILKPFQATIAIEQIQPRLSEKPSDPFLKVTNVLASLDYKGKNTFYGTGPVVNLAIQDILLTTLSAPCLHLSQNQIQFSLKKADDLSENQHVSGIATIKFLSGCHTLLPPLYQPVLNLIPLKEAGFVANLSLETSKNSLTQTKSLNLDFKTETQAGKPILLVKSHLTSDPSINSKGLYDGSLNITLNQVMRSNVTKKKKSFLNILTNNLIASLQDTAGQYVLDFDVKNNEILPNQKTIQRLTKFIFS